MCKIDLIYIFVSNNIIMKKMAPKRPSVEILLAGKAKYKEFQNMMNVYEFDFDYKYLSEEERIHRIKEMYVITNDESFIAYMESIADSRTIMGLLVAMIRQGKTFISQCKPENANILQEEISQKQELYEYYLKRI